MKLKDREVTIYYWNQFIANGNLNALSKVYSIYYNSLFDYGLRLTNDSQLVEDIIQNMFVNFINTRERIGEVKNLTGYLVSIFRRSLFKEIKAKNQSISEEITLPFDYFRNFEDIEINDKIKFERMYSAVKESINKLSDRQKEMIYLKFEKEISYEEISSIFQISVDSCYKLLYRSIKSIRKETEKILGEKVDSIIWFCLTYHKI